MMSKKITFQDPESRSIGLLATEEQTEKETLQWAIDDYEKLVLLCQRYGIKASPNMFFELSLALARELYPEPKKRGRKSKWNYFSKAVLVVEVERLIKPNDPAHGVEWACKQLAKREPWKSFLEAKESGTLGPNPAEALRKIYFDFRGEIWVEIYRELHSMYEHKGEMAEWKKKVFDVVRNSNPK
jgi:hypothetical protein